MNTYYKKIKPLFINIFCVIFSIITFLSTWQSGLAIAAIDSSIKLDKSDVLSDLRSDPKFNINAYPFNENGKLQLLSFNEYCYSFYSNLSANYGLYIYVYNPQCLNVVQNSTLNKIQMAVSYDENGNPTDYEKFRLQFCSVSTESDYYRLFYKFKVVDPDNKIYSNLKSNERRYDVSGIEIYAEGQTNAIDYGISKTFYYTGYAAGYGPNKAAESTLTCRTEKLETIELKVNHTYWRSLTSSKGVGYQNQLDTVYFTVPDYFFENYGKLQRIKAEWYEYKTKDIIVTSNQEFYNVILPYIGRQVAGNYGVVDKQYGIEMYKIYAAWGYNLTDSFVLDETCSKLYYLFHTPNWTNIENYDPYATIETIGGVSSNDLYEYILNYNKTYESGTVKDGRISADLFESDIDDYRKIDNEYGKVQQGYSYYDFDADVDLFDLLAYDPSNNNFTENWVMYGFWSALFRSYGTVEDNITDQTPILVLDKDEYLSGNNQDVSDRLFVNYNDVDKIKSAYNQAKTNKEKVILFRFAVSDYYSSDHTQIIKFEEGENWIGENWGENFYYDQAYRAKESVFLDFDIIQLTFNKEGVYTVIPVVASPIDIVDDITPPYNPAKDKDGLPWWVWVLIVIAIIIAVLLIIKYLPYILKGLFYLIKYLFIGIYYVLASPYYLIRWIVNRGR